MVRFQLFLPEPLVKALKALAKKTGVSVAEHVRRAVDDYLKRQE